MPTYITIQGDRLDRICKSHYGSERGGTVERVLDANPGLAALGPIYSAGIEIELPDIASTVQTVEVVHLWS